MNVTPHVKTFPIQIEGFVERSLSFIEWGWPWCYVATFAKSVPATMPMPEEYGALAADVAVGVLLVVALTWVSTFLLRHAGFLGGIRKDA
jgi:hypothetical protein